MGRKAIYYFFVFAILFIWGCSKEKVVPDKNDIRNENTIPDLSGKWEGNTQYQVDSRGRPYSLKIEYTLTQTGQNISGFLLIYHSSSSTPEKRMVNGILTDNSLSLGSDHVQELEANFQNNKIVGTFAITRNYLPGNIILERK